MQPIKGAQPTAASKVAVQCGEGREMRAAEERWAETSRGGDCASSSSDSGDETGASPRAADQPFPSSHAKAHALSAIAADFSGFDANGVFHPPGRSSHAYTAAGLGRQPPAATSAAAAFPWPMAFGTVGTDGGGQDDEPLLRLKPLPLVRATHISEGADLNDLCEQLFQSVPRSSLEEPEVVGS